MVFFQAALLAGYAYAHLLIRFLPLGARRAGPSRRCWRRPRMTLPIGIAHGFGAPPTSDIAIWLIGLFAVSIGLPFAVLSASAPLLQGWFAASGHPQARQSLRALRRLQSRIVRRADRLSDRDRAVAAARTARRSSGPLGFAVLAILIAVAGAVHRAPAEPRRRRRAPAAPCRCAIAWPGSRWPRFRPASSSRSRPTSRPTLRRRRSSGCCRSRSIC